MNKRYYQGLIETYGTSSESIQKVNNIFTQGDIRYADPEYEVIVAGFLDNMAICIEEKKINGEPVIADLIKGPQKDLKSIAMGILRKEGFRVIDFEKYFEGGIADIIAKTPTGLWVGVECGPCSIKKAIDYLERPDSHLWLIEGSGKILYEVKRGPRWKSFYNFHKSTQINRDRKAIEHVFEKKVLLDTATRYIKRKMPRVLTSTEVAELLGVAAENPRYSILLKCMYFLGMRNSEIQNLLIEDLDIINGVAKIVQGKGKKDRLVPIPRGFSDDLKVYIGNRKEGILIGGRDRKSRISDRHIRRIVKNYAKAANIRKPDEIHPHTLRHSYATHLQNSGVPLNIIQNLLGHERIETTTIYTHMGIEHAKEWVSKAFR